MNLSMCSTLPFLVKPNNDKQIRKKIVEPGCHTNYFQEKGLTVKCVLIGASDNLYSPVTKISLCTSSLIHFCVPADNVNNKELHLYIKENRNNATVIAVSIVAILFVQMITRGITS